MNVLLFVMTILMLLTISTYARVMSFRSEAMMQQQFEEYIVKRARLSINDAATKEYNRTVINKGKSSSEKNYAEGKKWLPIGQLFLKGQLEESRKILFKELLIVAYAKQHPFNEALIGNPNLFDEIVEGIIREGVKQEEGVNLQRIELEDPELNRLYNLMLKGSASLEGEEHYYPLETLVESQGGATDKIRLYLAPKPLLLVAFSGNEQVTEAFIEAREALYNQVRSKKIESTEATRLLKEEYQGKLSPQIEESLVDFTVTGTNPKER